VEGRPVEAAYVQTTGPDCAAQVLPPRAHLVTYHGVLAPAAAERRRLEVLLVPFPIQVGISPKRFAMRVTLVHRLIRVECCAVVFTVCAALLATDPAATGQCTATEVFALKASDAGQWDLYGRSVAISGNVAVVGALYQGFNGPPFLWGPGAAYVYRFDGRQWTQETILTNSVPEEQDHFGGSVAVSADRILVGAKYAGGNVPGSGAADVFRFDGTGWIVEGRLTASDGQTNDEFGTSVWIDGDVAVIGAPQNDPTGPGWAYIFRFNGVNWIEEAKLSAPDGQARDDFGEAVVIQGDVAAIGAPNRDHGQATLFPDGMGAVYLFRFDGNTWNHEEIVSSTEPVPGQWDLFGHSVALDGSVLAVGTNPSRSQIPPPGVPWPIGDVYVFRHDGNQWTSEAHLQASDGINNDRFGFDVALQGNVILAGAWGQWSSADPCTFNPADSGCDSGAAYLFEFESGTGTWVEQAKLTSADISQDDTFGWAVGLSGDKALIGAFYVDEPVINCGAAYVFGGIADCNTNGALDLCDVASGFSQDCNGNGLPDECDIASGASSDGTGNGIPDECEGVWTDLGQGLAGTAGVPLLTGSGALIVGLPVTLTLTDARTNSISALVIGITNISVPFKGGTLVPSADVLVQGLPTGPAGSIVLSGNWPPGIPSGISSYFQHWIVDPAGSQNLAASNGLSGTTP